MAGYIALNLSLVILLLRRGSEDGVHDCAQRLDGAQFPAASSASLRGGIRRDSSQFLLTDMEWGRPVYTHHLHPPNSCMMSSPHQYLNHLSDVAGTPSWTGTRSLLELVPGGGARSLKGVWIPLHGLPSTSLPALDPPQAVAGYRGPLTAFLPVESEPESPLTRRSPWPVSSRMVSTCSGLTVPTPTARRPRASPPWRLLPARLALSGDCVSPPLAPAPPRLALLITCGLRPRFGVSTCGVVTSGFLGGTRGKAFPEHTPESLYTIVCTHYREYSRRRASIVQDILWANGHKLSAGIPVKVGL
ncbi:hypothetical protein B0H13DRAFT_1898162 [Mycena leptocephala]|nr:hypothetical protein B0H13DRAFT_1898162 [Mycena leptocephala]